MTTIRRSATPSWRSSAIKKRALESSTFPDRISLPITTMAAVFTRRAVYHILIVGDRTAEPMTIRALFVACAAVVAAGCGEELVSSDGGPPDAGGPEAPAYGACSKLETGGKPRDPGACCVADTDCAGGFCVAGWCTKTCTAENDCRPNGDIGTPTPFPRGTLMHCLTEAAIGVQGFCWPGSGDPCDGEPGSCPQPGERCGVWFNPSGTPTPDAGIPIPDGLHGRCIAAYATAPQKQT